MRLTPDVDDSLQRLAVRERVSVNHLVNLAIRRLTEWETIAEKFGFVAIPSFLQAKVYNYLSDEQAKELGEWAAKNFGKDFVLFMYKKVNLDTVLESLKLLSSRYARIFNMEHTFDGKVHTVVVKHGLGGKGSVFNQGFLTNMFKELLNVSTESERTEDQVVVRLKPIREIRKPIWSEAYRRPSVERRAHRELAPSIETDES